MDSPAAAARTRRTMGVTNGALAWCECHHITPREHGGETTLSNLVMLCRVHHRQLHSTEWVVRIRDGLPEFVPPEWIDRTRTPRRKALPHLVALLDTG